MGRTSVTTEPPTAARAVFLDVVRDLLTSSGELLNAERERSLRRATQPDILWHELVKNIVGQGSDAGWKRLNQRVDVPVGLGYETLRSVALEQRAATVEAMLRGGGVRWPAMKAPWIVENVVKMERRHGPTNALELFEEAPGRDSKIAFLKRFAGVGDKLARNIPMNLYHPEFHDSIAIDARIGGISRLLGLRLRNYELEEQWYVAAAHDAGVDDWTLDRLMFHRYAEFKTRLVVALTARHS